MRLRQPRRRYSFDASGDQNCGSSGTPSENSTAASCDQVRKSMRWTKGVAEIARRLLSGEIEYSRPLVEEISGARPGSRKPVAPSASEKKRGTSSPWQPG